MLLDITKKDLIFFFCNIWQMDYIGDSQGALRGTLILQNALVKTV